MEEENSGDLSGNQYEQIAMVSCKVMETIREIFYAKLWGGKMNCQGIVMDICPTTQYHQLFRVAIL